jgi:hypothetical protein
MDINMRLDLVRCYYASANSPTGAIRLYKKQKGIIKDPCKPQAITKLIKKFERTYSLLDAPRSGRSSLEEGRMETVLNGLQNTSNDFGSSSIAKVSEETGISWSSVQRILRKKCDLYPYKLQVVQALTESDMEAGCLNTWPARSPDLNPLDYWFWGTLKARVFHNNPPRSLESLKTRIIEECARFTVEEFAAAISNLTIRLYFTLDANGGHIEQNL